MEPRIQGEFPEEFQKYCQRFLLSPLEQSLALLGYCLGMVAYAQWKEGFGKKPILSKLDYQGMNQEKVLRLFNTLFEKTRQYHKHISFTEKWLATASILYKTSPDHLTSHERLFYILLGYSLQVLHKRDREEDNSSV